MLVDSSDCDVSTNKTHTVYNVQPTDWQGMLVNVEHPLVWFAHIGLWKHGASSALILYPAQQENVVAMYRLIL